MTPSKTEQNSFLFLECLYCEEKCWDDDDDDVHHDDDDDGIGSTNISALHDYSSYSCCENEEEEQEQLSALFSKEEKTSFGNVGVFVDSSSSLMVARRKALEWMIRVNCHHKFSGITLVLGVNYFDRFMMSFGFQRERPWMTHVVAVACLSLASKLEETHVPLLLDFQVENKLIFEAKVIQKMELLVLSTLQWKMNAVTPLSYLGHLIRKLKLNPHFHWDVLCRCETLIFSAILDSRYLFFLPSILAAATMVQTLKEIGLWSTLEHQIDIRNTLILDKDKIEDCYKFIEELAITEKEHQKKSDIISARRSRSPTNVLDVVSNDSSNTDDKDLSSSSEPLTKKCRTVGPTCIG